MILFHTTTPGAAAAILRGGFRGASGSAMFVGTWFEDVVFLSVWPCDENEGAEGATVLEVDVGDLDMSGYVIEEEGLSVWEYVVPADVLNALPPGAVRFREVAER